MTGMCLGCGAPVDYGGAYCTSCECETCHGRDADCAACAGTGTAAPRPVEFDSDGAGQSVLTSKTFRDRAVVAEAEMAAQAIHPVTIAHGDPETAAEADLLLVTVAAFARDTRRLSSMRGGNDYTTYLFAGPLAQQAALTFMAQVREVAPTWWRINATAHPIWR